MTHVRLLPILLIAIVGLFFIKLTHLIADSGDLVGSSTPALAQEAQEGQAVPGGGEQGQADMSQPIQGPDQPLPEGFDAQTEPSSDFVDGMKVDPTQGSRSELAILERLSQRREALNGREKELEMREALLKAAEKRLQKRVDELRSLEESIKMATRSRRAEHEEDLGKLVAMYQAMKPKQAAKIFEVMDQDVLLDIIKIMNARKVAAIIGEMSSKTAGALSIAIARGQSLEEEVQEYKEAELPQIGN